LRVALDIFFGLILYSNDLIDDHGLLVIMDFLDPLGFSKEAINGLDSRSGSSKKVMPNMIINDDSRISS